MAGRGIADDGSIADIPWASVFDPDHNVRAFNAIQARGFRAATDVVERLVGLVDRNGGSTESPSTDATVPRTDSPAAADVERAVTAWQSILVQIVGSLRGAGAAPAGAVLLDLNEGDSREVLYLEAAASGPASAEVWLHNGDPGDLEPISLRCSDLLAHDGGLVKSTAVRVDPERVAMPGRCSRGVTVQIEVADGARPGRYRGTLLADGHPDVWLPIVLTVLPAGS